MTFALTSFQAYGIEMDEPLTKRFKQIMVLTITSANSDLTLDLGAPSGTFWTAVSGTEPGTSALKTIANINTAAKQFNFAGGEDLFARTQVAAAAAATDVVKTMSATYTHAPKFVYYTASAPTTQTLVLEWILNDDQLPVAVAG